MKTISIQQPMASQIVLGLKPIEYRSWATSFRGRVLIHASGEKEFDLPCDETTPLLEDISKGLLKMTRKTEQGTLAKNCEGHELEWEIFLRVWDYRADKDNDFAFCPCRAIVGSVEIYDCVQKGEKNFEWLLREPRALEQPLRFIKGRLNFWEYTLPPGITI